MTKEEWRRVCSFWMDPIDWWDSLTNDWIVVAILAIGFGICFLVVLGIGLLVNDYPTYFVGAIGAGACFTLSHGTYWVVKGTLKFNSTILRLRTRKERIAASSTMCAECEKPFIGRDDDYLCKGCRPKPKKRFRRAVAR